MTKSASTAHQCWKRAIGCEALGTGSYVRLIASVAVSLLAAAPVPAAFASAVDVSIGPAGAVTTDARGNVYFSAPNIVFKLDSAGSLTRVAGNGTPGYSGDGGPATNARLNIPYDNYPELLHDPIDNDPLVGGLAVDASGNLYIADAYNDRVRKVDISGIITTVAGGGNNNNDTGSPALGASLGWPQGLAVDSVGKLYVAGAWGTVYQVSTDGVLAILARNNCGAFAAPGLCTPEQIAIDTSGSIYVPDGYCRVRKISPDGSIVTVAGNDRLSGWNVVTCGYSGDGGPAINAALSNMPYGVAVDAIGNLYIADTYNNCIRKVDGAGIISTIAGVCEIPGYSGDGGQATAAHLSRPSGVAIDAARNLYIADTANNRIRKVTPDGVITTIAGNGGAIATDLPSPAVVIGPGFTGAWYYPEQSGHGLIIEVLPDNRFYASWFSFNPAGTGQAWFTGVGVYTGNTATITSVVMPTGGRWIPNFDPTQIVPNPWGTLAFTFTDCNHGRVDFNSVAGYGTGSMNLTRLTQPAGLSCP